MTIPALFAGPFGSTSRTIAAPFSVRCNDCRRASGKRTGLEADAQIAARDTALLEKYVHHAIHGGRGNSDRAESCETRSGNADRATVRVDYHPARGGGLQADIESHVRSKGSARPGVALRHDQADHRKSGNGAARSRAADHKRETARFERGNIAEFAYGGSGLRTL